MRFDQIEDFNKACADVAELAAKAIEEHRRQLDELGTIVREAERIAREDPKVLEATRLADRPSRADSLSSARASAGAPASTESSTVSEPTPIPKQSESLSDLLALVAHPARSSPDLRGLAARQQQSRRPLRG